MEMERFRRILKSNQENKKELTEALRHIMLCWGVDVQSEVLDILQMARMNAGAKTFIIEMPLQDDEIGAVYYNSGNKGYLVLNSSLPKVNVHFALCHEIYHIFCQSGPLQSKIELYLSEHYYDHKEECIANAFAGMLLMPEGGFRRMFEKINADAREENALSVIARLMNYYQAPYMAVLIRIYELGLDRPEWSLEDLLKTDADLLEKTFSRLWLNEELLHPTMRDDYARFREMVELEGKRCVENEISKDKDLQAVLSNMQMIYDKIRRNGDGGDL